MKKIMVLVLAVVATFAMAVSAFAVLPGKTVEFEGKGAGKVVFDGKAHADSGNKCQDCHKPGLFKMKKGTATVTMKDMDEGKFCGVCHNGDKAFSTKDAKACANCHAKEIEAQKEQQKIIANKEHGIDGIVWKYDKKKNSVTIRKKGKEKTKVTIIMENEKLPEKIRRGDRGIATYIIKDGKNVGVKLDVRGGC